MKEGVTPEKIGGAGSQWHGLPSTDDFRFWRNMCPPYVPTLCARVICAIICAIARGLRMCPRCVRRCVGGPYGSRFCRLAKNGSALFVLFDMLSHVKGSRGGCSGTASGWGCSITGQLVLRLSTKCTTLEHRLYVNCRRGCRSVRGFSQVSERSRVSERLRREASTSQLSARPRKSLRGLASVREITAVGEASHLSGGFRNCPRGFASV